ncbi:hypothetical protein [Nocardiopsis sp. JB363]|uniref:hypothetical protein n=1 Tax=Nocardiopsis sp. JB363 TaxID=1434837 RepID=UPI00097AA4F8|nr:hypothetical protein [Nocardiopsis sp. JB363]SIO84318.1 hypothetical protein BQ8420_01285 [Nocardiopsis sp. JB363]
MSPEAPARRSHLRWSRTDSVAMRFVLVLGMILVGATMALSLLWITTGLSVGGNGQSDRVTVHQPIDAPGTVPDVELSVDDVTIAAESTMTLVFEDPSALERLMLVLPAEGMVLASFEITLGSAPLSGLLVGLMPAALAEVFRRGARMRDDVDGLV